MHRATNDNKDIAKSCENVHSNHIPQMRHAKVSADYMSSVPINDTQSKKQ